MKLTHSFASPGPAEEVWEALIDPERVAPCLPGATLITLSETTHHIHNQRPSQSHHGHRRPRLVQQELGLV